MRSSQPAVSVVIPTYNRAMVLPRALGSVFSQSYQDFEIIVVDDGSTDNTTSLLNHYLDVTRGKCRSIKLEHTNAAFARNCGIENARGKYIAFLDSDDEWHSEKLAKQVNYLQNSTAALVHTGRTLVQEAGNQRSRIESYPQKLAENRAALLHGTANICMTVMARREIFTQVGLFDTTLVTTQDLDLWLRIAKCFEIGLIDEPLMKSHKLADSNMATNPEQTYSDRIRVFEKMVADDDPLIANSNWELLLATHSYRLACEKYRLQKYHESLKYVKNSLMTDCRIGMKLAVSPGSRSQQLKHFWAPYELGIMSLWRTFNPW